MRTTTLNISDIRPLAIRWKFSFRVLLTLGFLSAISLLFLYIFQVQDVTKASSLISVYDKRIAELSGQNKDLEINFSRVNSLANLETILKNYRYETVGRVHYIQILKNQVVAKP